MKKTSGDDGIPAQIFHILKDDAVTMLHSVCQQIWMSAVATGLEKVRFLSNPKEGQYQRMFKLLYNRTHLTCQQGHAQNPSSQTSIVHESRTSRCTCWILKAEEPEIKLPKSVGSQKKQESSKKNIYFYFIDYVKAFVWITTNCGKFLKRWEQQTTLPLS